MYNGFQFIKKRNDKKMINKILKENFTKDDFVNFIVENDIFYEFLLWINIKKEKQYERNKKPD